MYPHHALACALCTTQHSARYSWAVVSGKNIPCRVCILGQPQLLHIGGMAYSRCTDDGSFFLIGSSNASTLAKSFLNRWKRGSLAHAARRARSESAVCCREFVWEASDDRQRAGGPQQEAQRT